jgi:hypothetical protein
METKGLRYTGYTLAVSWLVGILIGGFYLMGLPSGIAEENLDEEDIYKTIPTGNPDFAEDQKRTIGIQKIARGLEENMKRLREDYEKIPEFKHPGHNRITQDDIEKFIAAYDTFRKEMKEFRKKTLGPRPKIFTVFAMTGMIQPYYEYVGLKARVRHQITEEEFDWIKKNIMMAAVFCVQYKLDNEELTEKKRKQLTDLRRGLYLASGVLEFQEDGSYEFHEERLYLDQVPRSNLRLFLDNYKRINYHKVHFVKTGLVEFDREAIMAAAANNPS